MASVFDTASYILQTRGGMTAMKLQKLCYYSQAWSLVWDEAPLFDEQIQAWANGPVVADLYAAHRGLYSVSADNFPAGNPKNLSPNQIETIDKVIEFYSQFNSQQLSDLTHMEAPWLKARIGIPEGERSDKEISLASMAEYYSAIPLR